LDKDETRLAEMKAKLSPNFFIRVPGVYGKEFDIDNCEDVAWIAKQFAPRSAIGSSLSHRKAMMEFYEHSEKEYALILEDDATPVHDNYMEEVETAIRNAPKDWDMIKLDYFPWTKFDDYNLYSSSMLTAYIVHKKSVIKINSHKVHYYLDIEYNFYNFKAYNNPSKVFVQIWDENNHSNAQIKNTYNPFSFLSSYLNFKAVRIYNMEITFADIFLFLVLIVVIRGLWYLWVGDRFGIYMALGLSHNSSKGFRNRKIGRS
jgi:GR25 family glycosyltransferase involved in LPS biosynthesis